MEDDLLRDRARGALLGLACGDCLGAPVEFKTGRFPFVSEMTGGGPLMVRPGQGTDDTAMMLALGHSLVANDGEFRKPAVINAYLDWAGRDGLGMGNTVEAALWGIMHGQSYQEATHAYHERSGGRSAGNGTIMRSAPLALIYRRHEDLLTAAARSDSHLTHHDALAAECSAQACRIIAGDLNGTTASVTIAEGMHPLLSINKTRCRSLARSKKGQATSTLAIGYRALEGFGSFSEGLLWAVNIGGDADTNAAVAGAMLGARYGASAIPEQWLETLEKRDEIVELADQLIELSRILP